MRSRGQAGLAVPRRRQGDDETARGAARGAAALVQFPDQVAAEAPQDSRPAADQRSYTAWSRGNTLFIRQLQTQRPIAQVLRNRGACCPARPTRYAAPPLQSTHVLGAMLPVAIDTFQRPAQRSIAGTHRIARWPRRTRAAPASGRVWPCTGAPCHTRILPKRTSASPSRNRCIGAPLAHLVPREHMKTIVARSACGNTSLTPAAIPRAASFTTTDVRLTLAKQPRPPSPSRVALNETRTSQVHPGQHRLALAEHLVERPRLDPTERNLPLNRARVGSQLREGSARAPCRKPVGAHV